MSRFLSEFLLFKLFITPMTRDLGKQFAQNVTLSEVYAFLQLFLFSYVLVVVTYAVFMDPQ